MMNFIFILNCVLTSSGLQPTIDINGCKGKTISFDHSKERWNMVSNSDCLDTILKLNSEIKELTILFSGGTYNFDRTLIIDNFQGRVHFKGTGTTTFKLEKPLLTCMARYMPLKLTHQIDRFDTKIEVESADRDISLVRIQSPDTVETAWYSRANDFLRVTSIHDKSIVFTDSINFAYSTQNAELVGFANSALVIEGIKFVTAGDLNSMMIFTGTSVSILNCSFVNVGEHNLHALVDLNNCENVRVEQVVIEGKVDYGFLINGSRNIYFTNIKSSTCLQPIVPATWTTNLIVEGLYCRGSVIDAHPSFNITYKDVTIEGGASYWNCRALGVHLENCYFNVDSSFNNVSLYLGVLALTKNYEYLYNLYDVICTNVKWRHTDMGFNGLHVHWCRSFIVDHCETHEVSVGPGVKEFVITNSHIGRVASANCNYQVENTTFDASLQGNARVSPPLSCSNEGVLYVKNCRFEGFEETYLFNYIHWPTTSITLENCTYPLMKGFVQKTFMAKDTYSHIFILNTPNSHRSLGMFDDVPFHISRND